MDFPRLPGPALPSSKAPGVSESSQAAYLPILEEERPRSPPQGGPPSLWVPTV